MASAKQIAANRRNALKSTGPRTPAGKARSRLNAVTHGLARSLPAREPAPPPATPLARVLAGKGAADPAALALAEKVGLGSLTLLGIRLKRARLLAGSGFAAPSSPLEDPGAVDDIPAEGLEDVEVAADTVPADDVFADEDPQEADPSAPRPDLDATLQALLRLERYERQALARRSRALTRLEEILAGLGTGSAHEN